VFDVTSNHTAGRSMPECPIPVSIRLENNFYEINVKLKLKTKNTGRSPIYLYSNSLRKEMFVS